MARFKLKAGLHVTGSTKEGTRKIYKKDEVFDTSTEKETAFCDNDKEKFERVSEPVTFRRTVSSKIPPKAGDKNAPKAGTKPGIDSSSQDVEEVEIDLAKLDHMTDKELQQFATEYGIDTKGAKDHNELLKNIKAELSKM